MKRKVILDFFLPKRPEKPHVKPPNHPEIQQLKPRQHLAAKRKVRISYVPFGKLELED
jgi:hypothetical protein